MSIDPARALTVAALIVSMAGGLPSAAAEEPTHPCLSFGARPSHTVTRIIDGETVALDDGRELRLIGALAPRASDVGAEAGRWPLEIAAAAELEAFVLGKTVELAFASERVDRYGRLQAHAFVHESGARGWVQGHLLRQGLARAYGNSGDRACAEALLAAERAAREAGRGLWAAAAYRIRQASRPEELSRDRSTFQVVEGRVTRVAQVRGTIYLNFSRDWRRGFSVSLRRSDRHLLGPFAENPPDLAWRRVRIRGWVERRRAPAIDLGAGGVLEVLDDPGPRAAPDDQDKPEMRAPPDRRRSSAQESLPGSPGREPRRPGAETKPPGLIEAGR
jgi:endonuclease YncB( thermonuclease family)